MKNLLSVSACILAVLAAPAMANEQSDRYARQIGAVCGLDMTKAKSLAAVRTTPGYFWAAGLALTSPGNELHPRDLMAAVPAVSCANGTIVVNESKANALIAAARKEDSDTKLAAAQKAADEAKLAIAAQKAEEAKLQAAIAKASEPGQETAAGPVKKPGKEAAKTQSATSSQKKS